MQVGSRDDVFNRPATESVAVFVGMENRLRGSLEKFPGQSTMRFCIGDASLPTSNPLIPTANAVLCIRAEDLSLSSVDADARATNSLDGKITGINAGRPSGNIILTAMGLN